MSTPSTADPSAPKPAQKSFLHRIFSSIFGASGRRRYKVEEVIMYSVHRAFYLWALILAGLIISALINRHPENVAVANKWAWVYIWIMFYTFVLLLFDIGTIKLILCTSSFALLWLAMKYIEHTRNILLIGNILSYFKNLHPVMTGGFSTTISLLLLVPWLIMLEESYRCGRKSFSPNGIEERNIGVSKEITDRAGLHFVCKYPDLLECVLGFGAGTILAMDNHGKIIKEWPSILGLYFKWDRLDEILHQRSATVDNTSSDPVEVEVTHHHAKDEPKE